MVVGGKCARFGIENIPMRRGSGCDRCQGIGYVGRVAVGELLMANSAIARLVLAKSCTDAIHEAAVAGGMAPLTTDAVSRAQNGITTLEELKRVLPANEEIVP